MRNAKLTNNFLKLKSDNMSGNEINSNFEKPNYIV